MKRFSNVKAKLAVLGTAVAVGSTNAMAALDTTKVAYNTDDATTVGGLVLAAVGVIWGVSKAINMASKG